MQVKLLRVLQEKKFTPVGSNREISVDVRIIAASHKPFEKMIKDGSFREDLFYRSQCSTCLFTTTSRKKI
jgi:two-component system response regulator HydG